MEFVGNNFEILLMEFAILTINILIHFTNASGIEIQKIHRTAVFGVRLFAVRLFAVWTKHSVQRTEWGSPKFGLRTPKILKKSEKGNRLNTYTLMDPVINNFIDKWNCFYEEVERYKLSIILMCD